MEAAYWHQRWERGEIAFHEDQANPLLAAHFKALNLVDGARVFVPLCGKTRDIAWLLAQGCRVVGVELNELAITELFKELGQVPEVADAGPMTHYRAKDIDIFAGDLFEMSAEHLGAVSAVYDRAALVALPPEMRQTYAAHVMHITDAAPQLLIAFEYDQSQMDGPPHSVCEDEIMQHFGATYRLCRVQSRQIENGLKGKVPATENAWLLEKD